MIHSTHVTVPFATLLMLSIAFPHAPEDRHHSPTSKVDDSWKVVHGDILVRDDYFGTRGTYTASLWPGGVVPFQFDPNVSPPDQTAMLNAMSEWAAVANITFRPRNAAIDQDFIHIEASNVNEAAIGCQGEQQPVRITSWGNRWIIVHELGHTLGLWHEHSRPDRDAYVQIHDPNIQSGEDGNFDREDDAGTFGAYDFDSIMHYHRCAFSICCPPGASCNCPAQCESISVLPPYQQWQMLIGQRTHLSVLDKEGMRFLYGGCTPLPIRATHNSYWLDLPPSELIDRYNVWEIELDFGIKEGEWYVGHDDIQSKHGLTTLATWLQNIGDAQAADYHPIFIKLEAKNPQGHCECDWPFDCCTNPGGVEPWNCGCWGWWEWYDWPADWETRISEIARSSLRPAGPDGGLYTPGELAAWRAVNPQIRQDEWPELSEVLQNGPFVVCLESNDAGSGNHPDFFDSHFAGLGPNSPRPGNNQPEFNRIVGTGYTRVTLDGEYDHHWSNIGVHPPVPMRVNAAAATDYHWATVAQPMHALGHAVNASTITPTLYTSDGDYSPPDPASSGEGVTALAHALLEPGSYPERITFRKPVTLSATTPAAVVGGMTVAYTIWIQVSDVSDAGTDTGLDITLNGSWGSAVFLDLDDPSNQFETGSCDEFWREAQDIGVVTSITLLARGSDDIRIDCVYADSATTGRYFCDVNAWVADDDPLTVPVTFHWGPGEQDFGFVLRNLSALRIFNGVQVAAQFQNLGQLTLTGGALAVIPGGGAPGLNNEGLLTGSGIVGGLTTNAPTGQIEAAGTLQFDGGLINLGVIFGDGTITGLVTNQANARIFASGTLMFADAVFNDGDIEVRPGVALDFQGGAANQAMVHGSGTVGGTLTNEGQGTVLAQGDLILTGSMINHGDVHVPPGTAMDVANGLTTDGLLRSGGTVAGAIMNQTAGTIRAEGDLMLTGRLTNLGIVLVPSGSRLILSGGGSSPAPSIMNTGVVQITGGQFRVDHIAADPWDVGTIELLGGVLELGAEGEWTGTVLGSPVHVSGTISDELDGGLDRSNETIEIVDGGTLIFRTSPEILGTYTIDFRGTLAFEQDIRLVGPVDLFGTILSDTALVTANGPFLANGTIDSRIDFADSVETTVTAVCRLLRESTIGPKGDIDFSGGTISIYGSLRTAADFHNDNVLSLEGGLLEVAEGNGNLMHGEDKDIVGHGTVDATIVGMGGRLHSNNGVLQIPDGVAPTGSIGHVTVDNNSVLDVAGWWDVTDSIVMNGGELTGGYVTKWGSFLVNNDAVISADIILAEGSNLIKEGATLKIAGNSVQPGQDIRVAPDPGAEQDALLAIAGGASQFAHGGIYTEVSVDDGGRILLTHGKRLFLDQGAANCGEIRLSDSVLAGRTIRLGPTGGIRGYGQIEAALAFDPDACGVGKRSADETRPGGEIVADESLQALTIAAAVEGIARLRADRGTLRIGGSTVAGTPDVLALAGGVIEYVAGSSPLSLNRVCNEGTLVVAGNVLEMRRYRGSGGLAVAGGSTLRVAGSFEPSVHAGQEWTWGSGSALEMVAGPGAADGRNGHAAWAALEVVGPDIAQCDAGNCFGVADLVVAAGSHVALVDRIDNGNRLGRREALHAKSLTVRAGAVLNLNGLRLYLDGSDPIVTGSFGQGMIIDARVQLLLAGDGDVDADGDVDLYDVREFSVRMTGPDPPASVGACSVLDVDADGDIDLADFAWLQGALTAER